MYYQQAIGGFAVSGSSPEILVRVREGVVTVRPIAGTMPRGDTPHEDKAYEERLLAGAGWGLGRSYTKLHHDFRYLEIAVVAGIVLIVAYLVVRRRRPGTMPSGNVDPPR